MKSERIYQIDFLRFLASVLVVLYHYFFVVSATNNVPGFGFGQLGQLFKYGYLGVDLFFIISGFVISLSIKERSLPTFISSRIVRLYPAYWISVLITSFVLVICSGLGEEISLNQLFWNLTMFQKFFGVDDIDGVYWSLFFELKFYILIVLYLLIFRLLKIRIELFIYSWLFLSIVYVFVGGMTILKIANQYLIFEWSSYFIAGMLLYEIYCKRWVKLNTILLVLCFFLSAHYATGRAEILSVRFGIYFSPFSVVLVLILFFGLLYLIANRKLQFLNSSKFVTLGLMTYPLYLIHQEIGYRIFKLLTNYLNNFFLVFATIGLFLFIAYSINTFVEKPVSKALKSKLNQILRIKRQS